jgi:hypothetical protein
MVENDEAKSTPGRRRMLARDKEEMVQVNSIIDVMSRIPFFQQVTCSRQSLCQQKSL